jgi:hypothetical protein
MSGPSPFVHALFSYKKGRHATLHTRNFRLASSYKLSSNTTHSGVGYYAPAAQTTLNPCVFLSSSPLLQRSSKTHKPLLILGFRAGALRHPAGDFLSDRFFRNNLCNIIVQHSSFYLSRRIYNNNTYLYRQYNINVTVIFFYHTNFAY